jgi:hypothetical protein
VGRRRTGRCRAFSGGLTGKSIAGSARTPGFFVHTGGLPPPVGELLRNNLFCNEQRSIRCMPDARSLMYWYKRNAPERCV